MDRTILNLGPAAAAFLAFLVWRWLAGPSLHWVESVIGLVLAAAVFAGTRLWLGRRLGR